MDHQLVSNEGDGGTFGGLLDCSPQSIATLMAVQGALDKHKQQIQVCLPFPHIIQHKQIEKPHNLPGSF